MKTIQTTCDIPNATAIDLGPLSELKDYVLELGPGVKIPGKVFGGAPVKAGGADFSFQVFAPGTNIPVKEGSVVRVAPAGKRAVRNTGDKPLVMLCVQYVAAAPGSVNPSDGTILYEPVKW